MNNLRDIYVHRYKQSLEPLATRLHDYLRELFADCPRIDRITARAKTIDSFIKKAEQTQNSKPKYTDAINQIQDQIGARIITFYSDDVERIAKEVERYFRAIETRTVVPDSEYEFGYFGKHFILHLPEDIIDTSTTPAFPFFELQIKTLFQHAWSEANHDLGYKPNSDLKSDFKRKIAFASAQAWGADVIFNELYKASVQEAPSE